MIIFIHRQQQKISLRINLTVHTHLGQRRKNNTFFEVNITPNSQRKKLEKFYIFLQPNAKLFLQTTKCSKPQRIFPQKDLNKWSCTKKIEKIMEKMLSETNNIKNFPSKQYVTYCTLCNCFEQKYFRFFLFLLNNFVFVSARKCHKFGVGWIKLLPCFG